MLRHAHRLAALRAARQTAKLRSLEDEIRAKGGRDEALYLKLMQKHAAFRDALMQFGC